MSNEYVQLLKNIFSSTFISFNICSHSQMLQKLIFNVLKELCAFIYLANTYIKIEIKYQTSLLFLHIDILNNNRSDLI